MTSRISSYDQCGPCGLSVDQAMGNMARANAAFSNFAWEAAKQEGCLLCPGQKLPTWPPRFTYPQQDKRDSSIMLGACPQGESMTSRAYTLKAAQILDAPFPDPTCRGSCGQPHTGHSSQTLSQQHPRHVIQRAHEILNS